MGFPRESERERLRRVDLASSTYHAVRNRALDEGWILERYLPDPEAFGFPFALFVLARPYAEKLPELREGWAREPGAVAAWMSAQVAFGAFFARSELDAQGIVRRLVPESRVGAAFTVLARIAEGGVPVFFDYAGLFAHLVGLPEPPTYPYGLRSRVRREAESTGLPERTRRTAAELAGRPFGEERADPGWRRLFGTANLPRPQRALLEEHTVDPRVLPDPGKLPPFQGHRADHVAFVFGELPSPAEPLWLLQALRERHRVCPFLFAYSGRRVLLGLLGQTGTPVAEGPAAPAPFHDLVDATFARFLRRIEVVRELAGSLTTIVPHRYDRLALKPPAPAPPPRSRTRRPDRG